MAQTFTHQFKITGPQMSLSYVAPVGISTIGRHPGNELLFVHPLVSRRHAQLDCSETTCQVTDLGSTHGTMVNRQRIPPNTPTPLKSGDVVEVGAFRMVYEKIGVGTPDVEQEADSESATAVDPTEETPSEEPRITTAQPRPDIAYTETTSYTPVAAAAPFELLPPQSKAESNGHYTLPPGLAYNDTSYLQYLPDIYQTEDNGFIIRFLAMLESILAPIEWNIDNFDLFLDPETAPASFLPWLANWFEVIFDDTWSEDSRRQLLKEAHILYRRRGTAWALNRLLEIYIGKKPTIDDQNKNLDPFTFSVRIPLSEQEVNVNTVVRIIDANKPAHTTYNLTFRGAG